MYFFKTFLRPPLKCMESQASEPQDTQCDDDMVDHVGSGKLVLKESATTVKSTPLFGVIRGSSSDSSRSEPEIEVEPGAVELDIDECIEKVGEARPWPEDRFQNVRLLQNAARNQGKVELQKDLSNGKFVAVKRMPITWTGTNHEDFVQRHPSETELPWVDIGLAKYLHAKGFLFICEPFGTFYSDSETYFVSEFADKGDLFEWCQSGPTPGEEREQMLRPVARQIVTAVQHLHSLHIAHCDLSLENILLTTSSDNTPQVKLIDFGMAAIKQDLLVGPRGKPSYQAPEMHEQGSYDPCLADAFSVGVVLFGMVAQDYPWLSTKPNGCKCFEFTRQKGLQAYLMKRKARNSDGARLSQVFS
ncbi:MARK1, partial [Symbiodinium pilosum]